MLLREEMIWSGTWLGNCTAVQTRGPVSQHLVTVRVPLHCNTMAADYTELEAPHHDAPPTTGKLDRGAHGCGW